MTGSRSLKVTGDFGIIDLPELAADALNYFNSNDYQQTQFAILDSVMPVADRELGEELDELAATAIRNGEERFELGLPVGFDDQAVSYRFRGPGLRGGHPDLLLRHYTQAMGERLPDLTADILHNHRIVAEFDDEAKPNANWPVHSALVGSLIHNNERFAINEGEWYRIEQSFKESIENTFLDLVENWPTPPEPLRKIYDEDGNGRYEAEADFNARFANVHGFVLLDRALIQVPGVDRSEFESCDVLDIAAKRFLHIKKSSRRSSVLSHFFKQGSNSARHFSMFANAWISLRELVDERAGSVAAAHLDAVRDDGRPWKVEFVIADSPRADGEFNIPFFSKVSLRDEVRMLRAMQYDAGIKFIGLQPDQASH
jgi:uncharacterized protein (TIGR04141 family)